MLMLIGGTSCRVFNAAAPAFLQRCLNGSYRHIPGQPRTVSAAPTAPPMMLHQCKEFSCDIRDAEYDADSAGAEIKSIFRQLDTCSEAVAPLQLLERLGVRLGNQEDAHEYLLRLLDEASRTKDDNQDPTSTFKGELRHVYSRQAVTEPFQSLSLPIAAPIASVEDALSQYFAGENNIAISKFPDTLVIDLKRFFYDIQTKSVEKIGRRISFGQVLDLSQYSAQAMQQLPAKAKYELSSVIVHKGSANFGHYVSFIRAKDEWTRCDDEIIQNVSFVDVMRESFGADIRTSPFKLSTADADIQRADGMLTELSMDSSTAYILMYRKYSDPTDT